jgi:tRNA modification GTPase
MDTIFATATAPIKAGVAVIRISGEQACKALERLIEKNPSQPRYASLNKIYNPKTKEMIDEALVLWFKSPASFTGEDVVELHLHGGRAVILEVLACLADMKNLRLAEPGEFSRRAFLNGKMDLTQAEGLADLIDAETKMQAKLALRQKQGELGKLYEYWREEILLLLAYIEAYIDFPDEEIPADIIEKIEGNINNLAQSIAMHLADKRGERLRDGLSVAIIGPPNAGKSSLLNLLAKRDVAIVSAHAGTTRDVIEVHLDLEGYPVNIADTAGIRDNAEEIEAEGIRRAMIRANSSDLKILVLDVRDLTGEDKEFSLQAFSNMIDENTVIVANKTDLLPVGKILSDEWQLNPILASFSKGRGVDAILSKIRHFAEDGLDNSCGPLITRERHRILLSDALLHVRKFSLHNPIELAAEDLRQAAVSIGRITGRVNVEEVLDRIFSSFCIGK